jgi:hypothetical protein
LGLIHGALICALFHAVPHGTDMVAFFLEHLARRFHQSVLDARGPGSDLSETTTNTTETNLDETPRASAAVSDKHAMNYLVLISTFVAFEAVHGRFIHDIVDFLLEGSVIDDLYLSINLSIYLSITLSIYL